MPLISLSKAPTNQLFDLLPKFPDISQGSKHQRDYSLVLEELYHHGIHNTGMIDGVDCRAYALSRLHLPADQRHIMTILAVTPWSQDYVSSGLIEAHEENKFDHAMSLQDGVITHNWYGWILEHKINVKPTDIKPWNIRTYSRRDLEIRLNNTTNPMNFTE